MIRGELSEAEWAFFEPFVIERGPKRGRPPADHRRVLDAVFWIARTGAPWRDLPEELGKWSSVYRQFLRWTRFCGGGQVCLQRLAAPDLSKKPSRWELLPAEKQRRKTVLLDKADDLRASFIDQDSKIPGYLWLKRGFDVRSFIEYGHGCFVDSDDRRQYGAYHAYLGGVSDVIDIGASNKSSILDVTGLTLENLDRRQRPCPSFGISHSLRPVKDSR